MSRKSFGKAELDSRGSSKNYKNQRFSIFRENTGMWEYWKITNFKFQRANNTQHSTLNTQNSLRPTFPGFLFLLRSFVQVTMEGPRQVVH